MTETSRRLFAGATSPRLRAAALVFSVVVHGAAYWLVSELGATPEFDFELTIPDEVEFGLTEAVEGGGEIGDAVDIDPAAQAVQDPPDERQEDPPEDEAPAEDDDARGLGAADAGVTDAGVTDAGVTDAGVTDAGVTDAGVTDAAPRDAGPSDAAQGDAGSDADGGSEARDERDAASTTPDARSDADPDDGSVDAGLTVAAVDGDASVDAAGRASSGTGRRGAGGGIPAGAQIAIRVDFGLIRRSPLAGEVRALVNAIPDWQEVLLGSGIDLVDDLDQLMVASPDLDRSNMVIAGRLRNLSNDPDADARLAMEAAVARMAASRGEQASWRRRGSVRVAPWHDQDDSTERVFAIVGPRHFTISRPQDLARVLTMAGARGRRRGSAGSAADALLEMGAGAAYSIEVEGARAYVRGNTENIPRWLRATIFERSNGGVRLDARGAFESEERADDARDYWVNQRRRARGSFVVSLSGFGPMVGGLDIQAEASDLTVRTELSEYQARRLLRFLRSLLPSDGSEITGSGPTF